MFNFAIIAERKNAVVKRAIDEMFLAFEFIDSLFN
jgi:hypothetical protein